MTQGQEHRTPPSLVAEAERIDAAVYAAVADTDTPYLDQTMRRVSRAADYSRLSIASAALLALFGGRRGRQAAACGLASVGATAAVVNVVVKPIGRRKRPDPAQQGVPAARQIRVPGSRSLPSGHTASAVAFASGASRALPAAGPPLHALAALVGYSRIHTGVHYPGDVVVGAVLGAGLADLTAVGFRRSRRRARAPAGLWG